MATIPGEGPAGDEVTPVSDVDPTDQVSTKQPLWRSLLAWTVAIGILAFLFRKVSMGETLDAFSQANLAVFFTATAGAVIYWFFLESFAFSYIFSRFNVEFSRREARSIRGLTYLVTPINWNVGTGAIILHMNRRKEVPALEATSTLMFYGLLDGLVLSIFFVVGLSFLPPSEGLRNVAWVVLAMGAGSVIQIGVIRTPYPRWGWLERFRNWPVFRAHRLATVKDIAILFTIRGIYFMGFVAIYWFGARAFNAEVPLALMAVSMPAVLMAAALPTPGGFGTQQAAMIYFYSPYGGEAAILAFSLALPIAMMVARAGLGLLYVRDLSGVR